MSSLPVPVSPCTSTGSSVGVCGSIIDAVLTLGQIASHPLVWGFLLASGVADFGVGMLLGFGLISTYAFRGNATAIAKGDILRRSLVKFQVPLDFLAIVTSIAYAALWMI